MSDHDRQGRWQPDEAASNFDELVRLAREEGPQSIAGDTGDVVVVAGEVFRRLRGDRSGRALVDALAASPYREVEIEPVRLALPGRSPVRL